MVCLLQDSLVEYGSLPGMHSPTAIRPDQGCGVRMDGPAATIPAVQLTVESLREGLYKLHIPPATLVLKIQRQSWEFLEKHNRHTERIDRPAKSEVSSKRPEGIIAYARIEADWQLL